MSNWRGPLPCFVCGEPKEPGPGRKYCKRCAAMRTSLVNRERDARRAIEKAKLARLNQSPQAMAKDAPDGQFWCSRCKRYLPLRARGNGNHPANRRSGYCKPCYKAYIIEYRLLRIYGLTVDEYDAMLLSQGDACAICLHPPRRMRLAVDHNHHTGEIRGLLCKRCNQSLLGASDHDPAMLRRAADYLEEPPSRKVLPPGHVVPGTEVEDAI